MSLKLRRGTNAERLTFTPALGELLYTIDTKQLYAGDGTTVGGTLVSYEGSIGGAMGSNLVLSGFSITGAGNINIDGTITSQGNIVSNGNITAAGDIIANGNIVLGNSNTDNVTIGADVNSNIIPNINNTFDLGTDTKRWNTLHVNNVFGDLEGNVRANDSTVLVDAQAGVLRGIHIGSLQGNVAGNVSGNVIGDLTGAVRAAGGQVVVNNGTDGTDAEFYGTFNGTLNGPVTNGVLTTEVYNDPLWINSLNGSKIFGLINNVSIVNSNLQGDVFADDSSILVDAAEGVLRGTHIGNLRGTVYTGDRNAIPEIKGLSIFGNTIVSDTNEDLILTAQGLGSVRVDGTIEVSRLEVGNDPAAGGILVTHSNNTTQPLVTFGTYDSASSSSGTGASAIFSRARGIPTAPTTLQNGDEIATLVFSGATATPAIPATFRDAANIMAKAVSVSTGSFVEGSLEFRTTNSSGVSATKLAINGDGSLLMTDSLLIAGGSGGQVNTTAPAKFVKVFIGTTAYAMPLYAIN
jgi:filamentous hemagglutinin